MSAEGANGISLMDAQRKYQAVGAVDRAFRRKVRRARRSEPLDAGWRPFDPDRDWNHPTLRSNRWPKNSEALYYWRSTYWNGDPDRLPAPPSEPTGGDRLVEQLREDIPETRPIIESVEWQYGVAAPMVVCELLADAAIEAYRSNDRDLGDRIAGVLAHGLDEDSHHYAWNCVAVGFLENLNWNDPDLQVFIDEWPSDLRDEIRQQQAYTADSTGQSDADRAALAELWGTSRGQPVSAIESQLTALLPIPFDYPGVRLHVAMTTRVLSDRHWLYRHPLAAVGFAWRHRHVQSPWRTLNWLRRPRFAG
jgi:hypothetical protein